MKSRRGFTLLELLLAITIFSVMAVALYSSFYAGIRILRRSEEVMKFHVDLRLAMEEIALDLRNSVPSDLKSEGGRGSQDGSGSTEDEKVYYFIGERKGFVFATLKDSFREKGMDREISEVKYSFVGEGAGSLIRSARYQSRGFDEDPSSDERLVTGLGDMEVLYSYEPDEPDGEVVWLDYWQQEEKIPLGVKIGLKLKGLGGVTELTKTVYIDTGALGSLDAEEGASPGLPRIKGL